MFLILLIILATVLGCLIMMAGPYFGGIIAFGIIAGCLVRALYYLNEIATKLGSNE